MSHFKFNRLQPPPNASKHQKGKIPEESQLPRKQLEEDLMI